MAITLRNNKGTALTYSEVDENFDFLDRTKYNIAEVVETKSSATGVVEHDLSNGNIFYHSTISADFTVNFINVPTTNNIAIGVSLILNQGSSSYFTDTLQINGNSVTIKWVGGVVPFGNANQIDVISYTLLRVDSTWTVLASLNTYN